MLGPAARTDALTAPPGSRRVSLAGATAVHTPCRRDFHHGNLLVLHQPPAPADLPRWLAVWERELGTVSGIGPTRLQWEAPEAAPSILAEAAREHGLELETSEVLVLAGVTEGRRHPAARPLTCDSEWEAVARLIGESPEEIAFFRWRLGEHRALVESGRGEWWGVVEAGEPVAAAGIFWGEDLVRFQEVVTVRHRRRQGLAGGLLRRMLDLHARRGTTVIVAERDGDGARLYRRLGFAVVGYQHMLVGTPPA